MAIDHQLEARTPHPKYVFLQYITFLDFYWRPFLVKKCRCYLSLLLKIVVNAIFNINRGCVAIDNRPKARISHRTYIFFQ